MSSDLIGEEEVGDAVQDAGQPHDLAPERRRQRVQVDEFHRQMDGRQLRRPRRLAPQQKVAPPDLAPQLRAGSRSKKAVKTCHRQTERRGLYACEPGEEVD